MTVTDVPLVSPARPAVKGVCPMGCGRTLVLDAGGAVRCRELSCPRPLAVFEILADEETDHVLVQRERDWTLQHPLRERLGQALLVCPLQRWLGSHSQPAFEPGRYRGYVLEDGRVDWDPLDHHEDDADRRHLPPSRDGAR